MSEIQRLNKLCEERKEAEDSLRKKWKKIEEFDARRSELESVYSALLRANMVNVVYCCCAAFGLSRGSFMPFMSASVSMTNNSSN